MWGSTYTVVVGVALIIGIAKGTKAVFQTLIIPDYVPLDRLPAAYGMQMVCNGILSIVIGPLIGNNALCSKVSSFILYPYINPIITHVLINYT